MKITVSREACSTFHSVGAVSGGGGSPPARQVFYPSSRPAVLGTHRPAWAAAGMAASLPESPAAPGPSDEPAHRITLMPMMKSNPGSCPSPFCLPTLTCTKCAFLQKRASGDQLTTCCAIELASIWPAKLAVQHMNTQHQQNTVQGRRRRRTSGIASMDSLAT